MTHMHKYFYAHSMRHSITGMSYVLSQFLDVIGIYTVVFYRSTHEKTNNIRKHVGLEEDQYWIDGV